MIIVTGGAGFIGSNIIKELNRKGINNIIVADNLQDGTKFTNLADLNITDYLDKDEFILKIRSGKTFGNVQAIFHEGACSCTTEWNGKYIMNNNYQYSKELLLYCLERKISFIYASSAAVYGNYISNFKKTNKYEQPLNIYGYSKLLFDNYVRQILPKTTSQVVGLRYFNVYGPREEHKGNMASMAFIINTQLKKGENPKLFEGSKYFKRDFIYIKDVVDVNLWFLNNNVSGIFDIGTGYAESFQNLAKIIIEFYKKGKIEYIPFLDKLKGRYQTFTKANLIKLREVGYKRIFKTILEGIKEYMIWLNNINYKDNIF